MEEELKVNKDIVLTITLTEEGIQVTGPINNEPLALYLCLKAMDVIKAHNIMQNQPKIQKPNGIMGFVRGFRK